MLFPGFGSLEAPAPDSDTRDHSKMLHVHVVIDRGIETLYEPPMTQDRAIARCLMVAKECTQHPQEI